MNYYNNTLSMEILTGGWYQPLMINHAALERMKVSSANYGIKVIIIIIIIIIIIE